MDVSHGNMKPALCVGFPISFFFVILALYICPWIVFRTFEQQSSRRIFLS